MYCINCHYPTCEFGNAALFRAWGFAGHLFTQAMAITHDGTRLEQDVMQLADFRR